MKDIFHVFVSFFIIILEHSPKPNVYGPLKAAKTDSRKPARANKTTLVSLYINKPYTSYAYILLLNDNLRTHISLSSSFFIPFWMVETRSITFLMHFLSTLSSQRGFARSLHGLIFHFGSGKQSWCYRCLGLDP